MKLSTKARYGLRALVHVAHRGYASAQTIAEQQSIPARYLEEIIGELRRAGLVVGKRGPRGGYRLGRPPGEITIAQIVAALANPAQDSGAMPAPDEISGLVERAIDDRLAAALGDVRLEQLLGEARERHRRSAANYVI
jgi:Rrf2 family protein